jgi:hypothetical protein
MIASTTLVVSFIVSFGVVKALANVVSGHLAEFGAASACWLSDGCSDCRCRSS